MAGPAHNTTLYKKNRQLILAGNPPCQVRIHCDGATATTADFIIPESKGGRPTLPNLRPACQKCNSARGNKTTTRYSAKW